jgi:hypothetical protein
LPVPVFPAVDILLAPLFTNSTAAVQGPDMCEEEDEKEDFSFSPEEDQEEKRKGQK